MAYNKEEESLIKKIISVAGSPKGTSWYAKVLAPKIIKNKDKYMRVAKEIGCPVSFIACIHVREDGADVGVFHSYLGNGQPINRKTTITPKGRGPFTTWEEGAIDALKLMGIDKIKDWTIERTIYEWEKYNGFGYRSHGINSPYVWSMMPGAYNAGKYTSDGKFNSKAVDSQIGCYAMYLELCKKDKSFLVSEENIIVEKEMETPSWFKPLEEFIMKLLDAVFGSTKPAPVVPAPVDPLPVSSDTRNLLVLKQAASQIGVKEIVGSASNPVVEEYLIWGGTSSNKGKDDDATAWCAGFVGWCVEKVGMSSTNSLAARSYEKWGVSTKKDPLPGDIVTFWRNSLASGSGHVGFFVKKLANGNVVVLGGNQSDEVNLSTYSTSRMTDIRRSSKAGTYTKAQRDELLSLAEDIMSGKKIKAGGKVV